MRTTTRAVTRAHPILAAGLTLSSPLGFADRPHDRGALFSGTKRWCRRTTPCAGYMPMSSIFFCADATDSERQVADNKMFLHPIASTVAERHRNERKLAVRATYNCLKSRPNPLECWGRKCVPRGYVPRAVMHRQCCAVATAIGTRKGLRSQRKDPTRSGLSGPFPKSKRNCKWWNANTITGIRKASRA